MKSKRTEAAEKCFAGETFPPSSINELLKVGGRGLLELSDCFEKTVSIVRTDDNGRAFVY